MKRLVAIVAAVAFFTGCVTVGSTARMTKAERREARRNFVEQSLDNRRYVIEVSAAQPKRYPYVPLSYGYSLEISGDTIKSYLPYYGRAYNIPYGGGKGLVFTAPISGYSDSGTIRGRRRIEVETVTDEDVYMYRIDLSDDGYAIVDVFARERESISFRGEMVE